MTGTTAVQLDYLAKMNRGGGPTTGQPLCPACNGGRLHPFVVEINLAEIPGRGWQGADGLVGWVAVCRGNAQYNRVVREWYASQGENYGEDTDDQPACGFSMPMTPRDFGQRP